MDERLGWEIMRCLWESLSVGTPTRRQQSRSDWSTATLKSFWRAKQQTREILETNNPAIVGND